MHSLPPNVGVSEKVRLKELEAGVGGLIPLLGVLFFKKQLFPWTLELGLGAILSRCEGALQVKGFFPLVCLSLWTWHSQPVLRQMRGGSKLG